MQTNMKSTTDSGLIQEQKKELLDRASAFPVNSTAETSGGTHGSHMYKLFFSPLQRAKRNSMVKWLDRSRACLKLRPSVTSYQCFRGRRKYHTNAGKILFFPLFFHPQKSRSKASVLDWSNIPKRKFTAFQQTVTSLDTLGIHIPFLSKLFISVTCYDHLIHSSYSCKKKPSTSRHTTLLVT